MFAIHGYEQRIKFQPIFITNADITQILTLIINMTVLFFTDAETFTSIKVSHFWSW